MLSKVTLLLVSLRSASYARSVNNTVVTGVVSFTWRRTGAFRIIGELSLISRTRMFTMITADFGIPEGIEWDTNQVFEHG
jgi:hypothetical protein